MKNCIIFIPTLTAGGAERVACILANEWADYPNVRVTVLTLFAEVVFYPLDSRVEHVCCGLRANISGIARARELLQALGSLRRAVIARRPQFVLSFMNKYNVFCLMALFGAKQKVIAAERDSPNEVLPRIRVLLRKLMYPLAAVVLVQSQVTKDFILSTIRAKRVVVLFNPVSQIVTQDERLPQKLILNVSRLHEKKGQVDLLEAFAAIRAEGWRLAFCGDGPMRSVLERRASELGIAEQTHFFGTVMDLRPHLRSAGIFVFPSYWEGFPNALAEAMLAGIPCVSYDCPTGPSELIENGINGILVPVGDINCLKEEISKLINDQTLRASLGKCAAMVLKHVELHSVSKQYWDTCLRAARGNLL